MEEFFHRLEIIKSSTSQSFDGVVEVTPSTTAVEPAKRDAAYQVFCERPMRLAPEQLKAVLDEDAWDR